MNKFHIVIEDKEIKEYKRFLWHIKTDNIHRLFSRLVGITQKEEGVFPIYLPVLSIETHSGQLFVEIHLTRYKSRVLLFDRNGIHSKKFDVREDL